MGYFNDNTVEVEHNGKKVRVCKEHAHIFQKKQPEKVEPKPKK